jgi:hypothetical protein
MPLANAVIPRDLLFDSSGAPSFAPQHKQRSSAKEREGWVLHFPRCRESKKARRHSALGLSRSRHQSRTFLFVGCDNHVLRVAAAIHEQQQRLVRSATNGRPELLHIVNGLAVHFLDDVAPL